MCDTVCQKEKKICVYFNTCFYAQIPDSIIIPVLLVLLFARHVIRGFALYPWLLYLASVVDIMGGYAFSATRSSISKCVDRDELGKVFAILASLESLVPIGMSQAYASLWKATSGLGPYLVGSCYFLSAGLTLVAGGLSVVGAVMLRGRDLGDAGAGEGRIVRPTYRMTTETEFLARWYVPPLGGRPAANDQWEGASGGDKTDSVEKGEMTERETVEESPAEKEERERDLEKVEAGDKY